MKKKNNISLGISGSREENLLFTHINEEKTDGISGSHGVEWPFEENGSSSFDIWYNEIDIETPPIETGKLLYNTLFSDKFKVILENICSISTSYDEVVIKIKLNNDPLLSRIPFEILHNGNFFLFSGNRTIVRYVDNASDITPTLSPLNKVLFILAEPNSTEYEPWGHDNFVIELEKLFIGSDVDYEIINHATFKKIQEIFINARRSEIKYSSIFVIAHGEPAQTNKDGYLVIETNEGDVDELSSSSFNQLIQGNQGCFVFLCSCSSGKVVPANPMASVGHHIIYNGHAGSVLSMQRPVTVEFGLSIVKSLIESFKLDRNIFQAYQDSLTLHISKSEHGVPSLYSRPMKTKASENPLEEPNFYKEYNRILSVFSIDINKSKVALIFPGFLMGLKSEDYQKAKDEEWFNIPKGQYKYRGLTTAKADINSGKGIIALLGKLFKPEEIDERLLIETDNNSKELLKDKNITHYIFFGSYSHSFTRDLLTQYSQDFEFNYNKENWNFIDKRTSMTYKVPNPNKEENDNYEGNDYAIIEKMIDNDTGKIYFAIAGMWDTSTLAAGKYLLANINQLYEKYGNGGFQIILSVNVGTTIVNDVLVQRRPLIK